jgi:hypothetical protein
MGAIAGRLVDLGGNVHGIIPKALLEYETTTERPSYGRTTVVGDMHTRKRLMAKEADAFIALPGGFGTMEELMEVSPSEILSLYPSSLTLSSPILLGYTSSFLFEVVLIFSLLFAVNIFALNVFCLRSEFR